MATNRIIWLLVCVFAINDIYCQNFNFGYLIEFTNKSGTIYNINHPETYLSERAIQRRQKYQIPITENDFPVNKNYCDSIQKMNAQLHVTSRWLNSAVFFTNDVNFENNVTAVSFVKKVTKVYGYTPNKKVSLHSKFEDETTHEIPAYLEYGVSFNQIGMINGQFLHNQGYLGQGLHIAVLDGGFYKVNQLNGFDSLFHNNQILGSWDFIDGNSNVYDDHTHGMNVLSILGGYVPNQLIGTAPKASYWLLRSENTDSEFPIEEENWIAAAEFADSAGVDIITASLGYSEFPDFPIMNYTYNDMDGKTTRVTRGAELAFSKGIFVVNSAGNSRDKSWYYLTAPSDGEHVLCVGAVDSLEYLASFSSSGPSSDGRIKPDVTAQGVATTLLLPNGLVGKGSGTSFSCPVVAGMVACLWQSLPHLSNQELLSLIRKTASQYNNPDSEFGYGIPDFANALLTEKNITISNYNDDYLLNAYPIPFYDILNIEAYIAENQTVEIQLSDLSGSIVFKESRSAGNTSLNHYLIEGLSKYQAGAYILTITTNQSRNSLLIVKDKWVLNR